MRFIDDLFLIWTGPVAALCEFRHAIATADEAIGFGWSGYGSQLDTANPEMVAPETVAIKRHDQVNVLDLDMTLQREWTRMGTSFLSHVSTLPQAG
jgi:hypothetical protein